MMIESILFSGGAKKKKAPKGRRCGISAATQRCTRASSARKGLCAKITAKQRCKTKKNVFSTGVLGLKATKIGHHYYTTRGAKYLVVKATRKTNGRTVTFKKPKLVADKLWMKATAAKKKKKTAARVKKEGTKKKSC